LIKDNDSQSVEITKDTQNDQVWKDFFVKSIRRRRVHL